jgi:protein-L-isoaspartate O-methyltransferase
MTAADATAVAHARYLGRLRVSASAVSESMERALDLVPRHVAFGDVMEDGQVLAPDDGRYLDVVYSGRDLVLVEDGAVLGRAPKARLTVEMLELADVTGASRALIFTDGDCYPAAVTAQILGSSRVHLLVRSAIQEHQARARLRDLGLSDLRVSHLAEAAGLPEWSADRLIIFGGTQVVRDPFWSAVDTGAIIVAPLRHIGAYSLVRFVVSADSWEGSLRYLLYPGDIGSIDDEQPRPSAELSAQYSERWASQSGIEPLLTDGFWYYLGIQYPDVQLSLGGVGRFAWPIVRDSDGWALLSKNASCWFGHPKLVERIATAIDGWMSLGLPALSKFSLSLSARPSQSRSMSVFADLADCTVRLASSIRAGQRFDYGVRN